MPRRDLRTQILRTLRTAPQLTPAEIASRLRCHPDTARHHIASIRTPARHWHQLPHTDRAAAARTTSVAAATVAAATHSPNSSVAYAAATKQNCPPKLLMRLLRHPSLTVRVAAAQNHTPLPKAMLPTAARIFTQIMRHPKMKPPDHELLMRLLRHPSLTVRLTAAAATPQFQVRRAAAAHPNCPPPLLQRLAHDPDPDVRAAAMTNPSLDPNIVDRLANSNIAYQKADAMRSPHTPPATLTDATRRHRGPPATAAAANPRLPLAGQLAAAQRPKCAEQATHETPTRTALAANPNLTTAAAAILLTDPAPAVRSTLAANPTLPAGLFTPLATDTDHNTRTNAARNPSCPPAALNALACDDDHRVRSAALAHLDCPTAHLHHAARSTHRDLHHAAARNPNCPPPLLADLVSQHPYTASQVAANPRCTPETLILVANCPTPGAVLLAAASAAYPAAEQLATHPEQSVASAAAGWIGPHRRHRRDCRPALIGAVTPPQ